MREFYLYTVKPEYVGKYCVSDESFWTESQLKDGKCPECGREVIDAKEEAYFDNQGWGRPKAKNPWGGNSTRQKKPVFEKSLDDNRKLVIDDALLDDLLRDDIDIADFLKS